MRLNVRQLRQVRRRILGCRLAVLDAAPPQHGAHALPLDKLHETVPVYLQARYHSPRPYTDMKSFNRWCLGVACRLACCLRTC